MNGMTTTSTNGRIARIGSTAARMTPTTVRAITIPALIRMSMM